MKVQMYQVISKIDGRIMATIPLDDESIPMLKKSKNFKFIKIMVEKREEKE